MGLAASPVAANTGFDFNAWFNGPSERDLPEIEIEFFDDDHANRTYCETRAPLADASHCTGGFLSLFHVKINDGYLIEPGDPPLRIGIECTTATGETGYGANVAVIIPSKARISNIFTVLVPNDDITYNCNKLIVNLRSLTPDRYKIVSFPCGRVHIFRIRGR